jgi:hypothetical protein
MSLIAFLRDIPHRVFLKFTGGVPNINELISPNGGKGPSVTKLAYLRLTAVATFGLLAMILSFCWVYISSKDHIADGTFAGAISALSLVLVGFVTNSHNQSKKLNAAGGTAYDPKTDEPDTKA